MNETNLPPGMELADCDAQPRHHILVPADDEIGFPAPCPACQAAAGWKQVFELEHRIEHRRHRWHPGANTKTAHRLVRWAYTLGIISGSCTTYSAEHNGCITSAYMRGRRVYLLGWERWKWTCLRRGHWPGQYIGLDCCGKCVPCPDCGSTAATCKPDCPATT